MFTSQALSPDAHAQGLTGGQWLQIYKGTAYSAYNMHIWQLHGSAVRAYDKFFG